MPDNGQTWCGCRADNSQLDGDYMCKLYKPEAGWELYEDEEGWELCKELEGLQLAFQLGIPHVLGLEAAWMRPKHDPANQGWEQVTWPRSCRPDCRGALMMRYVYLCRHPWC